MCTKLMYLMTKRSAQEWTLPIDNLTHSHFASEMKDALDTYRFLYAHTHPSHLSPYFLHYVANHAHCYALCPIRDLRDVLCSYVNYKKEEIHQSVGRNDLTFDEMLTLLLDLSQSSLGQDLEVQVQHALEWLELPHVIPLRFEDLVGPKGGGSLKKQRKTIESLAFTLGCRLEKDWLGYICENLFGNEKRDSTSHRLPPSTTFFEGQIGSWRKHFKPEHHKLFKKYWGDYQKGLKYSLD